MLFEEARRRERLAVEMMLVVELVDVRREEGERVAMGEKSQVSLLLVIKRTGVSGRGLVVLLFVLEESFVLGRAEEGFSERSVLGLMVERASERGQVEEEEERRLSLVFSS